MISILGYVLLGILLVSCILPIIDSLTGLILTAIEVLKGKLSLRITELNVKLKEIANREDEVEYMHPIGFITEEEEENDDDI